MVIAAVAGVCVLLLVLGFLVPKLSHKPQRGTNRALSSGGRAGSKAPGPLGRLLSKSFHTSNRAANRSASAGRKGRSRLGS